jgi:peptidoglycan-associated lipoprotein
MKRMIAIALLLTGTVMLAGCPKKPGVKQAPTAGTNVSQSSANGSESPNTSGSSLGGDGANSAKGLNTDSGPFARRVIYFDFDKSDIRPEFAEIVTTAAHALTANTTVKLKLEGNTDQRGTREYNIGLGERRAQAVRRALMLQGVSESQLSTTSFGAERPAVEGDDESAWSKNRRVELVYGQ